MIAREERFLNEEGDLEEMIEYGQVESRCEMCDHYLGKNNYLAYKVIPDRIWNEDNMHEDVQFDQTGDFIYQRRRRW